MSIKYENGTLAQLQGTDSPAISNNSYAKASGDFDNSNSSNLFLWANFELVTAFGGYANSMLNTPIELYLVPLASGSSASAPSLDILSSPPTLNPNHYKGNFLPSLTGVSSINKMSIEGIILSPNYFQAYLVNRTGQQMSAGWTLNIYPFRQQ